MDASFSVFSLYEASFERLSAVELDSWSKHASLEQQVKIAGARRVAKKTLVSLLHSSEDLVVAAACANIKATDEQRLSALSSMLEKLDEEYETNKATNARLVYFSLDSRSSIASLPQTPALYRLVLEAGGYDEQLSELYATAALWALTPASDMPLDVALSAVVAARSNGYIFDLPSLGQNLALQLPDLMNSGAFYRIPDWPELWDEIVKSCPPEGRSAIVAAANAFHKERLSVLVPHFPTIQQWAAEDPSLRVGALFETNEQKPLPPPQLDEILAGLPPENLTYDYLMAVFDMSRNQLLLNEKTMWLGISKNPAVESEWVRTTGMEVALATETAVSFVDAIWTKLAISLQEAKDITLPLLEADYPDLEYLPPGALMAHALLDKCTYMVYHITGPTERRNEELADFLFYAVTRLNALGLPVSSRLAASVNYQLASTYPSRVPMEILRRNVKSLASEYLIKQLTALEKTHGPSVLKVADSLSGTFPGNTSEFIASVGETLTATKAQQEAAAAKKKPRRSPRPAAPTQASRLKTP